MSKTRKWLQSYSNNIYQTEYLAKSTEFDTSYNSKLELAKTIAIASGKGGVGKTSIALSFAKFLGEEKDKKVLLIDCDFNLTNSVIKLGHSIDDLFVKFLKNQINIDDCIKHNGGFDVLATCSGELGLVDKKFTNIIIDIIRSQEQNYDFIILDCPAGISKDTLNLFAYCDDHIVVINPDLSSVTDSYSFIKIVNANYNIKNILLIANKINSFAQYKKITSGFISTINNFLNCSINLLGFIPMSRIELDRFDRELLKNADSDIYNSFSNIVKTYAEKYIVENEKDENNSRLGVKKSNSKIDYFHANI